MALQSTIVPQIAAGIVGELAFEGPLRAQPAVLDSASAALNVIGRAFQWKAGQTGSWAAGSAGAADPKPMSVQADLGAAGVFAGLLVNPKVYAQFATPFTASATPPNGTVVELATEGDFYVALAAATNPGDVVYFNYNTGVITCAAPAAAIPANCAGPIGTVERFVGAGVGIGVIHLEPRVQSLIP